MQHTCIWMFGWFYRIWRWRNCSAPESLWDNTRKKWSGPPRCWEPVASYEEWDLQTVSWSMELLWLGNAEFHHTLGLFFKFLQTHDLVQAIEPPMGLGLHSTFSFSIFKGASSGTRPRRIHWIGGPSTSTFVAGIMRTFWMLLISCWPSSPLQLMQSEVSVLWNILKQIAGTSSKAPHSTNWWGSNCWRKISANGTPQVSNTHHACLHCRHAWWVLLTCGVPFAE